MLLSDDSIVYFDHHKLNLTYHLMQQWDAHVHTHHMVNKGRIQGCGICGMPCFEWKHLSNNSITTNAFAPLESQL